MQLLAQLRPVSIVLLLDKCVPVQSPANSPFLRVPLRTDYPHTFSAHSVAAFFSLPCAVVRAAGIGTFSRRAHIRISNSSPLARPSSLLCSRSSLSCFHHFRRSVFTAPASFAFDRQLKWKKTLHRDWDGSPSAGIVNCYFFATYRSLMSSLFHASVSIG